MTTRTVYIAEDGKEFETEEECREYESSLDFSSVAFFMDNKKRILEPNLDAMDSVWYMVIKNSQEAPDLIEYIDEQVGLDIRHLVTAATLYDGQVIGYDYDANRWVDLTKLATETAETVQVLLSESND